MKEAMEFNNIYSIHKIIKNILKKVQDKKQNFNQFIQWLSKS